jgi:hypothetical protein
LRNISRRRGTNPRNKRPAGLRNVERSSNRIVGKLV